jgi:hypothetical protein
MRLSRGKLLHLSNIVLEGLKKHDIILKEKDEDIRKAIRNIIVKEFELDTQIDSLVRKKLLSYKKNIVEGSPEWDILYEKFLNEEISKRGMG